MEKIYILYLLLVFSNGLEKNQGDDLQNKHNFLKKIKYIYCIKLSIYSYIYCVVLLDG